MPRLIISLPILGFLPTATRTLSHSILCLLAVLLLLVGIAIAYDTFFADHASREIVKISTQDLNPLSRFIKRLSVEVPVLYGLFSIIFAVSLGVAAAFIRRFLSNLRKKYFSV